IRARLNQGTLDAVREATGSVHEIAARYGVPEGLVRKIKHEQLAAELKLPRPPIRISKSDKLLASMEQLQSTLEGVLRVISEQRSLPVAGARQGEVPSSYEGDGIMSYGLRPMTPPSRYWRRDAFPEDGGG